MRISLRLNAIEQEHLQELYNAAGVARDELPYTPQFEKLWQDFHDRTFKNADREQVFGAILRYVRSSTCAAGKVDPIPLTEEQAGRLKDLLRRHSKGGRLLPYSNEFEVAIKDFARLTKVELSPRDFWLAMCQVQGRPRRSPRRVAASAAEQDTQPGEALSSPKPDAEMPTPPDPSRIPMQP